MNITKSVILVFIILISFQDFVYATGNNTPQKLSQEAEKVRTFLNSINNINEDEKINIIEYFSKPDVGEAICIKNSPPVYENIFKKIFRVYETAIFGYSLEQWISSYYAELLRQNNCYTTEKKEYPNYKIDKYGTAVALTMRNKVKIPLNVDIPILTKNFSQDIESWTDISHRSIYIDNNTMDYCIEMNSLLNKQFPNTIPFRLAQAYTRLEKGSWEPYKNLLMIKICLGALTLLAYHMIIGNRIKSPCEKSIKHICMGLNGIILANLFTGFLQRKEERAYDLRAIELARPNNEELEEFFTLQPKFIDISSGQGWAVKELKIKKLEKPLEHSWIEKLFSFHYSPAQRLRYCKKFVKKSNVPKKKKRMEITLPEKILQKYLIRTNKINFYKKCANQIKSDIGLSPFYFYRGWSIITGTIPHDTLLTKNIILEEYIFKK